MRNGFVWMDQGKLKLIWPVAATQEGSVKFAYFIINGENDTKGNGQIMENNDVLDWFDLLFQ
jgi:hypothetical protein